MALETIISEVVVDVYNHDAAPYTIKAICGDSATRYVVASLTNDGNEYVLDSDATVELVSLRPDSALIISSAENRTYSIPEHDPIVPMSRTIIQEDETEVTEYYYVDDNGDTVYVETGDTIYFPMITIHDIYAELTEDVLSVIGTIKCHFRIVSGSQVLHTSLFYINNGIDLSKNASCVIDVRE